MSKGGKREGAGRPTGSSIGKPKTEMVAFRCTPEEKVKAEKIGNGNASKGLRRALAAYERHESGDSKAPITSREIGSSVG